jgi:hypothetical protein
MRAYFLSVLYSNKYTHFVHRILSRKSSSSSLVLFPHYMDSSVRWFFCSFYPISRIGIKVLEFKRWSILTEICSLKNSVVNLYSPTPNSNNSHFPDTQNGREKGLVYRVPQCLSLRPNWLPIPLPTSECVSPLGSRGRGHARWRGRGGRSHFRRPARGLWHSVFSMELTIESNRCKLHGQE